MQTDSAAKKCPNWTYGRAYGLVSVLFQQGHETFYPFTRHSNLSFFAIVMYSGREIWGGGYQALPGSALRTPSLLCAHLIEIRAPLSGGEGGCWKCCAVIHTGMIYCIQTARTHTRPRTPAGENDGLLWLKIWPFVWATLTPSSDAVGQQIVWPSSSVVRFEQTEPRQNSIRPLSLWFCSQFVLHGNNWTAIFKNFRCSEWFSRILFLLARTGITIN